jgi:predicted PurR-regulated permease PerM
MRDPRLNPWSSMTDERVTFVLKLLMVVVLAFYAGEFVLEFLARIRAVVYILIGSIFLAYLVYPAVQRLRRRMPLLIAILLVYALILVAFALAMLFVVPHIVADIGALIRHYPELVARLNGLIYDPNDPITSRLPDWMRRQIAQVPTELALWVRVHGFETFGHLIYVLVGTFAAVATFIIVPLITAYLLLDLDHLKQGFASLLPEDRWHAALALMADVDGVIGGFIRGQLIVALMVGGLITLALTLLHVHYAFLLGLLAAVGDLIPYVGAVLAFIPAFTSAWLTNGWINALVVAAAFAVIYEVEGHLIAPNVVSKQVSLSPFIVLLALLVGAELGGLFGMLIAVPIAGVLRVLALRVFRPSQPNEVRPSDR